LKNFCITLLMIVFSFLIVYPCQSQSTTVYRDRTGRYQGRSVHRGNITVHRNRTGRYQGKSIHRGNTNVNKDRSGKYQGKIFRKL